MSWSGRQRELGGILYVWTLILGRLLFSAWISRAAQDTPIVDRWAPFRRLPCGVRSGICSRCNTVCVLLQRVSGRRSSQAPGQGRTSVNLLYFLLVDREPSLLWPSGSSARSQSVLAPVWPVLWVLTQHPLLSLLPGFLC